MAPADAAGGRRIVLAGVLDALRLPALVIGASMVGFGSLARDSGIGMDVAMASTVTVWGLPGQVAFAELFAAGAPVLAIMLASSMANLRFLPMSLSLMPLFRSEHGAWRWRYLLVAMMSVNTWAVTLRRSPTLAAGQRAPYFVGVSLACMTVGVVGTAMGYHLAGELPFYVTVSLIYLNPVYFTFLLAGVRQRPFVLALVIGAVLGPLIHLVSPDWGLIFCGLIAGSAGYWLGTASSHD